MDMVDNTVDNRLLRRSQTLKIRKNSCMIDSAKMKDPYVFTVAMLKDKLRQMNEFEHCWK